MKDSFPRMDAIDPSAPGPRVSTFGALAAALLLGTIAYVPSSLELTWTCDDHAQTYGHDNSPIPTLLESLRQGGRGSLSPNRLLNLPFLGYLPRLLGPVGCHGLATALHISCGAAAFFLWTRLGMTARAAAVGTAIFLVCPVLTQATMWWAAAPCLVATLLYLLSCHAFVSYRKEPGGSIGWLLLCMSLLLLQLLFYELWLAGVVALGAISWVLHRPRNGFGQAGRRVVLDMGLCFIPFALYAIAFVTLHKSDFNEPHFLPARILPVLASIHGRFVQSALNLPWSRALQLGADLNSTAWLGLSLLGLIALLLGNSDSPRSADRRARPLTLTTSLVLAYAFFLSARLVFLVKGASTTAGRTNYGGTLSAAFALAAIWGHAQQSRRVAVRAGGSAFMAGSIALLLVATKGMGQLYAQAGRAEANAYAQLSQTPFRSGQVAVIVGYPSETRWEDAAYNQLEGLWLERRLRAVDPSSRIYVVPSVELTEDHCRFRAFDRDRRHRRALEFPRGQVRLFAWRGEFLFPLEECDDQNAIAFKFARRESMNAITARTQEQKEKP